MYRDWRRRRPGCAGDKPGATAKPQEIVPCRKSLPRPLCLARNKKLDKRAAIAHIRGAKDLKPGP